VAKAVALQVRARLRKVLALKHGLKLIWRRWILRNLLHNLQQNYVCYGATAAL
jgi:hypothetical protein